MGMTSSARGAAANDGAAGAEQAVLDLESMRTVAGWVLRLVLGVATVTAIVVAMIGAPMIGALSVVGVLLVAAALGTVLAPGSVLPLVVLICLVLYRVAAVDHGADVPLMVLAALMALIHQLAGICAVVPARSSCQWAALRPAAIRYLAAVVPVEIVIAVMVF